jgi:DNA polymerase III subunit epsilon
MAEHPLTDLPILRRHLECFAQTWSEETAIDKVRFVVLDSETTGLNPRSDRIISIGAVGVLDGEIVLDDSFEALIKVSHNTSAVTVHGLTRDESRSGMEEPEALEMFLDYLKDGVIVGHHIGHDITALNAGYERHWGFEMSNRALDTMDLTLHLEKAGAFSGRPKFREFTLDALSNVFGVIPHDRHTATGDAFITAQIFLRLRRLALRFGRERLGLICQPFEPPDAEIARS